MKWSGADKALLITVSGASVLVLVFFIAVVKPYEDPIPESYFEIPVIPEEEYIASAGEELPPEVPPATTHQAYNAALEQESKALFTTEDPVREALAANELPSVGELDAEAEAQLGARLDSLKEALSQRQALIAKTLQQQQAEMEAARNNRPSTVSYNLQGRQAITIPNPVYTCDVGGTVTLDIAVNEQGIVSTMSVHKKGSSTNGCLIDQALFYANQARFEKADQAIQKGTLTFYFQE